MTAIALIRELKLFLLDATKEYNAAKNSKGEVSSPKIFEWSTPLKISKNREPKPNPRTKSQSDEDVVEESIDDELFPYIVIRPIKGTDEEDESNIQVELLFGIKDAGVESKGLVYLTGYDALFTFLEFVKIKLQQAGVVGDKFKLEKPLVWESYQDDYPFFEGILKTTWSVGSISSERSYKLLYE